MKNFKSKLLEYFNLTENEYEELCKDVNLEDLPSYKNYLHIDDCANFIHEKIKKNTKTLIYGDYDCDGIMATSIIFLTLKTENFTPGFYIPSRENDGYGLTIKNIDKFNSLGYKLIILVDNGISLYEQIKHANSLGIDVVVLDHHTLEGCFPDAKFILHPIYSNFSKVNMSAGSVAFFFSIAYLQIVDEYLLTLAAISTISDLMPLIEYNRLLVKLAIKIINKNKYENVMLLMEKDDSSTINEQDISMLLVPKINAIGRLINDNSLYTIVKYFIRENDTVFIKKASSWIKEVNLKRKKMITDISLENSVDANNNSIIVVEKNINEGLIGLLAAKFMNDYNKPTAVLIEDTHNNDLYKGSMRSKEGFNVNVILDDLKDILISYGGHKNAGGFVLEKNNFDIFKNKFEIASKKHPFKNYEEKTIEISLPDVNKENFDILNRLAPFGQDFKEPKFMIKNIKTSFLQLSRNKKHIYTKFSTNGVIVYFNYDKNIYNNNYVDLIGNLNINYFNGLYTIQFTVLSFLESK